MGWIDRSKMLEEDRAEDRGGSAKESLVPPTCTSAQGAPIWSAERSTNATRSTFLEEVQQEEEEEASVASACSTLLLLLLFGWVLPLLPFRTADGTKAIMLQRDRDNRRCPDQWGRRWRGRGERESKGVGCRKRRRRRRLDTISSTLSARNGQRFLDRSVIQWENWFSTALFCNERSSNNNRLDRKRLGRVSKLSFSNSIRNFLSLAYAFQLFEIITRGEDVEMAIIHLLNELPRKDEGEKR